METLSFDDLDSAKFTCTYHLAFDSSFSINSSTALGKEEIDALERLFPQFWPEL